ncbi:uncharacterized protein [Oscarella lobularis]|uniref:uncharacterized protein n=1 Tax=Oscarella lobularis TaxID=121494 RepID=UPI0033137F8B
MMRLASFLWLLLPKVVHSQCTGSATYKATFTAIWTSSSHPKDYPTHSAHWSGVVGGSHNSGYTMWKPGGKATAGVKNVAERGTQSTLVNEMKSAGKNVLDTVTWFSLPYGTGTRTGDIDLDSGHTLVSLITMIAPSPDWFVGVHDYDLCNGLKWIQSVTVDLFPYDAGTDSGLKFTSANSVTSPAEPIYRLTGTMPNNTQSSFFGYNPVKPMARFNFALQSRTTPTTSTIGCKETATYRVEFDATWSASTHPGLFPSRYQPNWLNMVVATHNSDYTMWTAGIKSTSGVKFFAEVGATWILVSELRNAGSNVGKQGVGPIIPATGKTSVQLEVDAAHPLVSAITKMGPSPDWFTGVHDIDVCPDGSWASIVRDALLYDAGTDSGKNFTSSNQATNPPQNIFRITSSTPGVFSGKNIAPFGKFTLRRVGGPRGACTAEGSPSYDITFTATWTAESHPGLYPSNAHWSRTVAASHNGNYVMWTSGATATRGVKDVAERGDVDVLEDELDAQKTAGNVRDHDTTSSIGSSGTGTRTATIVVDKDHPLVSSITMIAPSPDWFVGIHDVSLCEGSEWKTGPIKMSLRLYMMPALTGERTSTLLTK